MTTVRRIAIVEDHRRTREGLAAEVEFDPTLSVVGAFASMEEALPSLERDPPDVLLTDIGLPGISGIEGVRRYRARHPDALVLVLSVFGDDGHVFEAICAGASGYLLKDTRPDALRQALHELLAGGAPMAPDIARRVVAMFRRFPSTPREHDLSPRELDVLRALGRGHSYKTAALALGMSIDTVRFHIRSIYAKLHVHSKSEAVVEAIRRGIV
jgi:two-component system nitrate/nitrite response regulator NarL